MAERTITTDAALRASGSRIAIAAPIALVAAALTATAVAPAPAAAAPSGTSRTPPATTHVAPVPASVRPSRYTVAAGDTVSSIAARLGLHPQTLLDANGLGWSTLIFPGQVLRVPTSSPTVAHTAARSASYTVAAGDTVSSIAARLGLHPQTLLDANGLGWSTLIFPGQVLAVPGRPAADAASAAHRSRITPLTAAMRANATTIIRVGRAVHAPDRAIIVALTAAAAESGLVNTTGGDRDSVGLFQQRPSTGWGPRAALADPATAARTFYLGHDNADGTVAHGLLDIPGWRSMTIAQAAQAVQISARPHAYDAWVDSATAWLALLG